METTSPQPDGGSGALVKWVSAGVVAMALLFGVLWWGGGFVFSRPVPVAPPAAEAVTVRDACREAAIWFLKHRAPDGHWSFRHFPEVCGDKTCEGGGDPATHEADEAATGLVVLALQALPPGEAGMKEAVAGGLAWLASRQDPEGSFGKPTAYYSEYNTAFPVLAMLAEGGARPDLRAAVEKALPYLAFTIRKRAHSDDSVGLSLLALRRAKAAGFAVEESLLGEGLRAIKGHQAEGQEVTAAGILFRVLGDPNQEFRGKKGTDTNRRIWAAVEPKNYDLFGLFLRGELVREFPGREAPPSWSSDCQTFLLSRRRKDGHAKGSFDPTDAWGPVAGRLYSTACALRFLGRSLSEK